MCVIYFRYAAALDKIVSDLNKAYDWSELERVFVSGNVYMKILQGTIEDAKCESACFYFFFLTFDTSKWMHIYIFSL